VAAGERGQALLSPSTSVCAFHSFMGLAQTQALRKVACASLQQSLHGAQPPAQQLRQAGPRAKERLMRETLVETLCTEAQHSGADGSSAAGGASCGAPGRSASDPCAACRPPGPRAPLAAAHWLCGCPRRRPLPGATPSAHGEVEELEDEVRTPDMPFPRYRATRKSLVTRHVHAHTRRRCQC